jgi:hypothetical protein
MFRYRLPAIRYATLNRGRLISTGGTGSKGGGSSGNSNGGGSGSKKPGEESAATKKKQSTGREESTENAEGSLAGNNLNQLQKALQVVGRHPYIRLLVSLRLNTD